MAFMKPEFYHGRYFIIARRDGSTDYVPADRAYDYDTPPDATCEDEGRGYLGRLSAPGYLDCTDWTPVDAADENAARAAFCGMYDICPRCYEPCWENDIPCAEEEV